MKKEFKHNHQQSLIKSQGQVTHNKSTKIPQHTNSLCSNKQKSNSPSPNVAARDSSPIYNTQNTCIGSSVGTKRKLKNHHQNHLGHFTSQTFTNKRLSVPKNTTKPPSKLVELSFNKSLDDESYYSGECHISQSIRKTQVRQSKSPKNMINLKKKSSVSTTASTTPAIAHQQALSKKRNSQVSSGNEQNLNAASNGIGSSFASAVGNKQFNNFMIDSNITHAQIASQHKTKLHSHSTKSQCHKSYTTTNGQTANVLSASKHAGSATNKAVSQSFHNQNGKFAERRFSAKAPDNHRKTNSKGAIQYENLMLQQLLKQQKDLEKDSINKNLSVKSGDQHLPLTSTSQIAPHMMLNISYNTQNHQYLVQEQIDRLNQALLGSLLNQHSQDGGNSQLLLHQEPSQLYSLIGLTNDQQVKSEQNSILDQKLPYKTQVDFKKHKLSQPYSNQSSLLDGQISYDQNSIVQAIKNAESKYREQSFDKIKKKKRTGSGSRKNQQSNSSRRLKNSNQYQSAVGGSQSRSNSSKHAATTKNRRDSSRVVSSNNPTSSHSNSSYHPLTNQKKSFHKPQLSQDQGESFKLQQQDSKIISINTNDHDRLLLEKLNEALARDLLDKSSAQKVGICSKVWSEIIRREDPIISSLLTKIKHSYEQHIKSQNKLLTQQQREIDFEQQLKAEKNERQNAETKIENLSQELKRQQSCIEKQESVINDMKKQILAYRQEIIELSTSKKHHFGKKGHDRDMKVPRLDLSKVQRDSEDESDSDAEGDDKDKNDKDVTYQQYLKFLENESRFDEMGEESQESLMRQEELKQRKNKIIQLLNGEISDEDEGDVIEQNSSNYNPDEDEEDIIDDMSEVDLNMVQRGTSPTPQKNPSDEKQKEKHKQIKQQEVQQKPQRVIRDFNIEINGARDVKDKPVMRSFS